MSYAIKNVRTGRFVYGTDYRYNPPHQRTSSFRALVFDDFGSAQLARQLRKCTSYYKIVPVEIKEQEHE